ncbi:peptidyl-dipeptidase A [Rhodothalassium salexigens DSM 2132]|uniref:Peptidyl-dipeptidase A n=1 Tax=Rhodothalassium salexigens DSM 2132 TaxID=1188247 RepID=A0A4R2P8U9_RHOSA|nr:M2 family metallopeptidase [Rhodothalassium salexigens]MBB4212520.1 peptidyl-dipeptidase A [Rhodothalassium salexigens DSM 2132]MBK1638489.1 peptidyl-dipeptidase [Rhodothalassium salexigens DSM 2132]TCP31440.1 peptidyl-dipeptidase A [Rhodothalassium salexigens DSM 2132]
MSSITKRAGQLAGAVSALALLAACDPQTPAAPAGDAGQTAAETAQPTAEDARAFVERAGQKLAAVSEEASRVFWINANFITYDSNWLAAKQSERLTKLGVDLAQEARRFDGVEGLDADTRRKLMLLKESLTLPAPAGDDEAAAELARITTELQSMYGTGEVDGKSLGELSETMASSRDYDELLATWVGWRDVAKPMKDMYAAMVDIANQGAGDLGYDDTGVLWRSKYDMDPDAFAADVDRLWGEVKPLYESLHCHVRAKLGEQYGTDKVPQDGPIPAHLLGNMWAQQWGEIFDLVAEGDADPGYDLTQLLKDADYDHMKMVETADNFFTSVGFEPLPETFYERSLFLKPEDRDVVCHASAWNLDDQDDIRIKMCIKPTADDFKTIHHEIGHNIYQRAYKIQPPLYRGDPNDGFHEAIGDMIALSITPDYLKQIGLLDQVPSEDKDIGLLMAQALDKVAFLPFGLLVDKWRWQVFSGELTPDDYNEGWWKLREQYQGVTAPVDRAADAFDPGAKYHVPGNTPYMRYFLAHIFQFQFHRAACEMAGWDGPLHRCSIYGNKEVGEKFNAMLEMGASKTWQEALEAFTGQTEADATAIQAYFKPLKDWLDEQNQGRSCGW